jgi:hypothetical protein
MLRPQIAVAIYQATVLNAPAKQRGTAHHERVKPSCDRLQVRQKPLLAGCPACRQSVATNPARRDGPLPRVGRSVCQRIGRDVLQPDKRPSPGSLIWVNAAPKNAVDDRSHAFRRAFQCAQWM